MIRRVAFAAVGLLLAAGIIAPFVQANRFGGRIKEALQNSLHRRVDIGEVRLNLFTGPGFSVENVLIYEDPSFGIEPFASVLSMEARVRLSSLWTGRLEFSTLTLDDPSVNLVKPEKGQWNIIPLLQQTSYSPLNGSGKAGISHLPVIQVRSGRLNFKFGNTKSPFYLTNANVDISPRSGEPGSFDVSFVGEPARTDRTAQGFGTLNCRGRWITSQTEESRLDLNLELEKSAIDEMARLVRGRAFGLHGLIASKASIKGPLSNLQVAGQFQIEDIHRWDLIPAARSGGVRVNYRGTIDWRSQKIELTAAKQDNPGMPIALRFRVFDYLSQPHWAADVTFDQLPASPLVEVARHMGTPLPKDLGLDGKIVGVVGYASVGGMQGQAALEEASIQTGGATLQVKRAELSLNGDHIRLDPTAVTGESGDSAEVSGDYQPSSQALQVAIKARSLNIAEMKAGSGHLLSAAAVPLLENFSKGLWTGTLNYEAAEGKPGGWTGTFDLRDVQTVVPGLKEPVRISSASVVLDGERVTINRLRARVEELAMEGEYRYEPGETRPHRFKLSVSTADLADLERLFLPTLRRERGFLARTLKLRAEPIPDWMATRHADGTVRIGQLTLGDSEWTAVKTRVVWDGPMVELSGLEAIMEDSAANGSAAIDLSGTEPKYKLRGRLQNLSWQGGSVDLSGRFDTTGTGADFLQNMQSEGSFQARSLTLFPENPITSAAGSYTFSVTRLGPRIKLTEVQAALGTERFSGQGTTQRDGKLQLELASANRVMHVTGPLAPLRLDMTTIKQ
jgi:AsmA protein